MCVSVGSKGVFPACTHTFSQFTCCLTRSLKKHWMSEQRCEQSNLCQVDCCSLIISLRLKTANLHSVKVKIQPKYTKFGNYTNTAWRYWSPRMYMSGNGRCNYNKYCTCIHHNGHLICVQASVVGEINIFSLILFHSACGNLPVKN